jgi:hypothetical protein
MTMPGTTTSLGVGACAISLPPVRGHCAARWAQVVGAPRLHPHEHWSDHPQKSVRGPDGSYGISAIFWRLKVGLTECPMDFDFLAEVIVDARQSDDLKQAAEECGHGMGLAWKDAD